MPLQWPLVGRHEELDLFAATLADPRAHGFVIHGAAGVGKTRLADQCLAVADSRGRFVARATASEGSRSIPLGALAHLLPAGIGDERHDLVTVMSEVRPVLQAQAENGPLVLFIDDLQLLDTTSATFVGQLVDADLLFLLATVRADASLPIGLDALWHRARVRRVDLDDLDRAGVDTLLGMVLEGPVEASTVTEIWTASRGNALFVREIVLGAIEGGHLVNQHGVWRLVGSLVTTQRLQELVASRLGAMEPAATAALERLAVWEPTGLWKLEDAIGDDSLELLDRAGLLTVRADGRRQIVTLANPLYGDIIRARLPALIRRRLLFEHAECIDALGARRREDTVRSAIARLESSGSADAQLLVRAARLARYGYDFPNVERLSRAALREGMTPEIGLLLGEALHELRAFAEADDVLTAAGSSAAADDPLLVHIAEIRSRNLMWGLFRPKEALEANQAARDRVSDRRGKAELVLSEALLLTYSGQPLDALAVLDSVAPVSDQRARALRAVAEVPALVATGRCATAAEAASLAFAEHSELPDQIAIPRPGVHMLTRVYALAECGRLDDAVALATTAYEAVPHTAPPDALMWLSHQLGRCALLRDRSRPLAAGSARRWPGATPKAASARADWCCQHSPPLRRSSATPPRRLPRWPSSTGARRSRSHFPSRSWVGRGRWWRPGPARRPPDTARSSGCRLPTTGYRVTEAWLLHDVARLGGADSVAGRLDDAGVHLRRRAGRCVRQPRRCRGRRCSGRARRGHRSLRAARRPAARRRVGDRSSAGVPAARQPTRRGDARCPRYGTGRGVRGSSHTRPDLPRRGRAAHRPGARCRHTGGRR